MAPSHNHSLMLDFDATAQELGMADVVLMRLCQTFKIPQAAFTQTTGLSPVSMPYKGDLIFSRLDIHHLKTIRDAIERGTPIKVIKQQFNPKGATANSIQHQLEQSKFLSALHYLEAKTSPDTRAQVVAEIKPPEEAAKQSFDRYKHREQPQAPVMKTIAKQVIHPSVPGIPNTSPSAETAELEWMPAPKPIIDVTPTETATSFSASQISKEASSQPTPQVSKHHKISQHTQQQPTQTKRLQTRASSKPSKALEALGELFPKISQHQPFRPWEVGLSGYHHHAKIWPEQVLPQPQPVKPNAFRNNAPVAAGGLHLKQPHQSLTKGAN